MTRVINLFFVRHGHGHHNAAAEKFGDYAYQDILYKDADLTTVGINQAKELRKFFKVHTPHLIYSSSLKRCIQTMHHSIDKHDDEIHIDDRLLERLGDICNHRSDKEIIKKVTSKKINLDKVDDEIPWLFRHETNKEILERANNWYNDMLIKVNSNNSILNVVVYSHYEFLEVIFKEMLDKENKDNFIGFKNCEVRKISINL